MADGFRLPPERELAATYRLARNTVRRALDQLDGAWSSGWSAGAPCQGTPAPGPREFLGRLSDASPTDVMEVRLIIEPHAAALAAHRACTDDLAEHRGRSLRKSIAAKGTAEFEHWDAALHLAIFRATKNALLVDYCEAINAARNQPHWYRLKQKSMTEDAAPPIRQEHSAVSRPCSSATPKRPAAFSTSTSRAFATTCWRSGLSWNSGSGACFPELSSPGLTRRSIVRRRDGCPRQARA